MTSHLERAPDVVGGDPPGAQRAALSGPDRPASARPDSVLGGVVQAGPLALAGLAHNAANVVATVVLARLLATGGYGALNQLTGVFLVVSTPGTAVVVAVVRRVTTWGDAGAEIVPEWARRLHRRATTVLVVFAAVVVAVGPTVARALGRADPAGFEVMAVAGAVWIVLCIDRGLLQAHRAYGGLSANLLVEGGLRTGAMLALAAAAGVTGAAVGLLAAEVATAAHARLRAERVWEARPTLAARSWREAPVPMLRSLASSWPAAWRPDPAAAVSGRRRAAGELALAVVALAMLAVLQNGDVIVIGAEGPSVAGAYAAVSVSCKVLVFGALVVAGYLLPEAAIRWRAGSHALRQLGACALLLGVPAAVLVVVAGVFPARFLGIVFSGHYRSAAGAFLALAVAMACLSATVVMTIYLVGVGHRRVVAVLVAAAAALLAVVAAAHGRPVATAQGDLCVQAATSAVVAVELAVLHHRAGRTRKAPAPG